MKFEEIFKENGLYVADGFAQGFCFRVDNSGILKNVFYKDSGDLLPNVSDALVFKTLFEKDYRKVLTRQSLFNSDNNQSNPTKK